MTRHKTALTISKIGLAPILIRFETVLNGQERLAQRDRILEKVLPKLALLLRIVLPYLLSDRLSY